MPEDTFVKWLAELGIGGAFAGLLFYFYRKDVKQYTELWRQQADLNHAQTTAMMALVERNMAAITENTQVLRQLHHRIDRLDMFRLIPEDHQPPS